MGLLEYTLAHTVYRASEIVLHMETMVLFCVFCRSWWQYWWIPCILWITLDWILALWLLYRTSPDECDHRYFAIKMFVAVPLIATNVAKFVDESPFAKAANKITCVLEPLRFFQILLVVLLMADGHARVSAWNSIRCHPPGGC